VRAMVRSMLCSGLRVNPKSMAGQTTRCEA
jgi:hypothetical protein